MLRRFKISVRDFLLGIFESQNSEIKHGVSSFESKDGPAVIVHYWKKKLRYRGDDKSFAEAAVDVVLDRTKSELNKVCDIGRLRVSADESPWVAHDFSMSHIENELMEWAPLLMRTITGMTEKKPKKQDAAMAKKQAQEREPTIKQYSLMAKPDPTLAITISSMLVHRTSHQSNYLQMMMGLYFASVKCPKRVVTTLSAAHFCVCHQTSQNALKALSEHNVRKAQQAVLKLPWSLLYDNINMGNRKYDQRVHNTDTFENGTTATIVIQNCAMSGPAQAPPKQLLIRDFMPDEDNRAHFRKVFNFHLFDALQRHSATYERCSISLPPLEPLPIAKTKTYPLPAMKIDQSSNEGNLDVLMKVVKDFLKLPEGSFDSGKRVIISGDQLTTARITSLQEVRMSDITPFSRLEWAVPVTQLFHLEMLLCSTILRTHYGSISAPGSLAFNIALLDRKRVGLDSADYHAADGLLRHTFEAMVLRLWEVELATDNLENFGVDLKDDRRINDLISGKVESIRQTYISNAAGFHDRLGTTDRNATLFLRDMMIYMEFCAAIKAGDIGRIQEALKLITLMVQAKETKNYANELLRITYGIRHGWSPLWKQAILSSWLINPEGKENGWIPADLYQEHNNLLIKNIHSPKGSNMSWQVMATTISTNIRLFSKIASTVEKEYAISFNSNYHSTMSAALDVSKIKKSLEHHNILCNRRHPHDGDVKAVNDLIKEGTHELYAGRFKKFVEKNVYVYDRVIDEAAAGSLENDEAVVVGLEAEDMQAENYIRFCFTNEDSVV
ncbi:hypothetical protein BGZ75_000347 [Mortierella antarctica]|nr:hypothetical protein BGZ75_000347 [Mortierella antarctica]